MGPFHPDFIQFGDRAEENALFGQGGQESFVEQIVLVGDHALDAFSDGSEGFARAEAIGTVGVAAVF